MDFERLNKEHLKKIIKISELRNSFVHYKWKALDESIESQEEKVLVDIEKTIKYLKNIENKYLMNNTKKRIRTI